MLLQVNKDLVANNTSYTQFMAEVKESIKRYDNLSENMVDPELLSKNKFFDAEHLGLDIGLAMSIGFAIMLVVDFIFSECQARRLAKKETQRKLGMSDNNIQT